MQTWPNNPSRLCPPEEIMLKFPKKYSQKWKTMTHIIFTAIHLTPVILLIGCKQVYIIAAGIRKCLKVGQPNLPFLPPPCRTNILGQESVQVQSLYFGHFWAQNPSLPKGRRPLVFFLIDWRSLLKHYERPFYFHSRGLCFSGPIFD